jgi:hypothetical protein
MRPSGMEGGISNPVVSLCFNVGSYFQLAENLFIRLLLSKFENNNLMKRF